MLVAELCPVAARSVILWSFCARASASLANDFATKYPWFALTAAIFSEKDDDLVPADGFLPVLAFE